MKPYKNEPQKFSFRIILAAIIIVFWSLIVSYLFYIIEFELLIIFSVIKILLVATIMYYSFKYLKIYSEKYSIAIGVICAVILFLFPYILGFIEVSASVNISFAEYVDALSRVGEYTFYVYPPAIPVGPSTGNPIVFYIFEIIKVGILLGGFYIAAIFLGTRPFSTKWNKFYSSKIKLNYNKLKNDSMVQSLNYKGDLFSFVLHILDEPIRFRRVKNAMQGTIELLAVDEEPEMILNSDATHFILNKEESKMLYKKLQDITKNLPKSQTKKEILKAILIILILFTAVISFFFYLSEPTPDIYKFMISFYTIVIILFALIIYFLMKEKSKF